jgi:hypothetical protein
LIIWNGLGCVWGGSTPLSFGICFGAVVPPVGGGIVSPAFGATTAAEEEPQVLQVLQPQSLWLNNRPQKSCQRCEKQLPESQPVAQPLVQPVLQPVLQPLVQLPWPQPENRPLPQPLKQLGAAGAQQVVGAGAQHGAGRGAQTGWAQVLQVLQVLQPCEPNRLLHQSRHRCKKPPQPLSQVLQVLQPPQEP